MTDLTLTGSAWKWANRVADHNQPLQRGRFVIALADALDQHLAEPGVSRAVALELGLADALAAMELSEVEPIDDRLRPIRR